MMNVKHGRKQETFHVDGKKLIVTAYGKTYVGNPAGFNVKVRDEINHPKTYHVNVLEIGEAIFRGLHKYLQREMGYSDLLTVLNYNTEEGKPVTVKIDARNGRFNINGRDGEFLVQEKTSCSDDHCGFRHWELYHADDTDTKVCSVCKHKNDDEYTAVTQGMDAIGFDLYEAATRLICKL